MQTLHEPAMVGPHRARLERPAHGDLMLSESAMTQLATTLGKTEAHHVVYSVNGNRILDPTRIS